MDGLDEKPEHVLVGVCDEKITASYVTSWQCNKLGGYPDWMDANCEYPSCNACGDQTHMYQVAQVYCPLEASSYHRTIYAFACVKKMCLNNSNSWRVFRCQLPATSPTLEDTRPVIRDNLKVVAMAMDEWCKDAGDWGSDSEDAEENLSLVATDFSTKSSKNHDGMESLDHHSNSTNSAPDQPTNDKQACIHTSQSNCSCNSCGPVAITTQHSLAGTCISDERKRRDVNSGKHTQSDVTFSDCSEEESSRIASQDVVPTDAMKDLSINAMSLGGRTINKFTASRPPTFDAYFVNVFDEPVSTATAELTNHERELMLDYQQREGVDFLELQEQNVDMKRFLSAASVETYEKTKSRHGDEIFTKFAKRLRLCPGQCIRYCWNGSPLYITLPHESSIIPSCPHCGGPRIFELQLMPALIRILQDPHRPGAAVDFGTVLIYTCRDSCWSDVAQPGQPVLREEHVVFQLDPDSSAIAQASSILLPESFQQGSISYM